LQLQTNAQVQSQLQALQSQLLQLQMQTQVVDAGLQSQLQGLQSQLQTVNASLASHSTQIEALQNEENIVHQIVSTHTSQIANLQAQVTWINNFLSATRNSTCEVGSVVQGVQSTGVLSCVPVQTAALSVTTVSLGGPYPPSPNAWLPSASCPVGYTLTGGGFSTPGWWESTPYVRSVTWGPFSENRQDGGGDYYFDKSVWINSWSANRDTNLAGVEQSYPNGNTWQIWFHFRPGESNGGQGTYAAAYAQCVRIGQ
jgi:hypothetical protein